MKRYDRYLEYKTKQIARVINKMKRLWASDNMMYSYRFSLLEKYWIIYEEQWKNFRMLKRNKVSFRY